MYNICLGVDHDMATCEVCQALDRQTQVARARMLSLWRDLKMAKPPTTTVVRRLKKEGRYPNLLSIQAVDAILYGQTVPQRGQVPARAPERQASQKRRRPTARVLFDSGLPDYTAVDGGGEVVAVRV